MEITTVKQEKLIKALLICGIIAAVLYVATDIYLAMLSKGYSYFDQAISELSAIGAPTRPLWIAMSFLFNPLLVKTKCNAGPRRFRAQTTTPKIRIYKIPEIDFAHSVDEMQTTKTDHPKRLLFIECPAPESMLRPI